MQATQILMNEHRLIEVMLDCLETMANRCTDTGELDSQSATDAVWFLRTFADSCHHAKEENGLFPMMEAHNVSPEGGPTAVMRSEHAEGRELLDRIEAAIEGAAAGDAAAGSSFADHSRRYVVHLRDHIDKEDHCLFPIAAQMLSGDDRQTLEQRFSKLDAEGIGQETIDKCREMAESMAERYGVKREALTTDS